MTPLYPKSSVYYDTRVVIYDCNFLQDWPLFTTKIYWTIFRIVNAENEPPYAVLNSRDFEEEEEEGYETIPASERRNGRKESQEVRRNKCRDQCDQMQE